jgi:hypothetical protein
MSNVKKRTRFSRKAALSIANLLLRMVDLLLTYATAGTPPRITATTTPAQHEVERLVELAGWPKESATSLIAAGVGPTAACKMLAGALAGRVN